VLTQSQQSSSQTQNGSEKKILDFLDILIQAKVSDPSMNIYFYSFFFMLFLLLLLIQTGAVRHQTLNTAFNQQV